MAVLPLQELYRWPLVADTGRTMLGMRYRLIPYLYTAFHTASRTGAPVMRPLFMNFPLDRHTHANSRRVTMDAGMDGVGQPAAESARHSQALSDPNPLVVLYDADNSWWVMHCW